MEIITTPHVTTGHALIVPTGVPPSVILLAVVEVWPMASQEAGVTAVVQMDIQVILKADKDMGLVKVNTDIQLARTNLHQYATMGVHLILCKMAAQIN